MREEERRRGGAVHSPEETEVDQGLDRSNVGVDLSGCRNAMVCLGRDNLWGSQTLLPPLSGLDPIQ